MIKINPGKGVFAAKYPVLDDGQPVVIPMSSGTLRLGCCDCRLVHDINFNIEVNPETKEMQLVLKFYRNNRSTAQARRWKKDKSK
jgi:hypothetical protein